MTPESIELLRLSFSRVKPVSRQFAGAFYRNLFDIDPSLRTIFRGDMSVQGDRLMRMLSRSISALDELDKLAPDLNHLGERHETLYGITMKHYASFGEALLTTLEDGLGSDFKPAVRQAWAEAYREIVIAMNSRANQAAA